MQLLYVTARANYLVKKILKPVFSQIRKKVSSLSSPKNMFFLSQMNTRLYEELKNKCDFSHRFSSKFITDSFLVYE